jgi:hypothetical protein
VKEGETKPIAIRGGVEGKLKVPWWRSYRSD